MQAPGASPLASPHDDDALVTAMAGSQFCHVYAGQRAAQAAAAASRDRGWGSEAGNPS